MFEWNEENEQNKSTTVPAMLAMPQQAPPVNRIHGAPASSAENGGVEANGILETLLPLFL
ncbi:hypothetical protein ACIRP3_43260 [Streptomyces sp. NPDC101209]|uniref:hypothetical protein n=1 Tax=Streptomyces sp. NPDC101209 TaxID=3366129 RepID=UPI0038255604